MRQPGLSIHTISIPTGTPIAALISRNIIEIPTMILVSNMSIKSLRGDPPKISSSISLVEEPTSDVKKSITVIKKCRSH